VRWVPGAHDPEPCIEARARVHDIAVHVRPRGGDGGVVIDPATQQPVPKADPEERSRGEDAAPAGRKWWVPSRGRRPKSVTSACSSPRVQAGQGDYPDLIATDHVSHTNLVPFDKNIAQPNLTPVAPKGKTARGFYVRNPQETVGKADSLSRPQDNCLGDRPSVRLSLEREIKDSAEEEPFERRDSRLRTKCRFAANFLWAGQGSNLRPWD
jgi:hypothetical protein